MTPIFAPTPFPYTLLDYDRRIFKRAEENGNTAIEFLKMQLWGNSAEHILNILRKGDACPQETTLSKVRLQYFINKGVDHEHCLDDIKFDGKFTIRGNSFASHNKLVSHVIDSYSSQIKNIEKRFSLRPHHQDGKNGITGSPITFQLSRPIVNIELFCEHLFSSGPPFRLWGIPIKISEKLIRVKCVDLHVGASLNFEISQEFIRMYLYGNSCGNTILRFYTNIQHHYDASVKAIINDHETLF